MFNKLKRFAILIVIAMICLQAAPAEASSILALGAFANYAILVEGGTKNVQFTSSSDIHGNVGLGQIGITANSVNLQGGNQIINGNLDFGAGSNGTGSVTVTGTTNTNVAAVGQAIIAANGLATTYAAFVGSDTVLSSISGNTVTEVTGGVHVYEFSSALSNGLGLTINAPSTAAIVFNVTGNSNPGFIGNIFLTGGITADNVLFNVIGTGNMNTNVHGSTFNGIILNPNGKVNVDNFIMNGRIFGSVFENDFQFVSGADITAPKDPVPEPTSFVTLGLAFLGMAIYRTRRNIATVPGPGNVS